MRILKLRSSEDATFRYEIHKETYNFPNHMHHFIELTLMLNGSLTVNVGGKKETLESGQLAMIFPFQSHSYESETESSFVIFTFSPSLISDFLKGAAGKTGEKAVFDASEATKMLFRSKYIDSLDTSPYGVRSSLYSALSDFTSQVELRDREADESAIGKMVEYMNEHYKDPLPLTEVARAIGYSANYLSHCIYKAFGTNYCSLLASIRVEHAKYLLQKTGSSIIEVALECGFGCERSFSRQFKKITGHSPKDYRPLGKIHIVEMKHPYEIKRN